MPDNQIFHQCVIPSMINPLLSMHGYGKVNVNSKSQTATCLKCVKSSFAPADKNVISIAVV